MKAKKLTRLLIYFFLAVLFAFSGYAIIIYTANKPPVEEINRAREALASAKGKKTGKYAVESFKKAEKLYNDAIAEWEYQNRQFFMRRDFSFTSELAVKSYNQVMSSVEEADESRMKLKQDAEHKLALLKKQIEYFEKYYKNLALGRSILHLFSKGKTYFTEAQIEFKRDEYVQSLRSIFRAEQKLSQAEKLAFFKLTEFYNNYPGWQENTRLAYNLSQKGQIVFLIDKMESSLIVLKSGKEFKTFAVEFGENWMGDKVIKGDKATPEGIYKVQTKKSNSKTKYYKALLLNYPNKEDQKQYDELVRLGRISKNAGIGGLVEIHGEGGKGVHWTDGCIALENGEMDIVYRLGTVNTPVIIVGSRKSMEEYLN
jgi:ABC-type molybdate transport system substrate-binding protein